MGRIAIYSVMLVLGALCFSQAIALMALEPLPGDFDFTLAGANIHMPILYSLGATAGLGLLIWFLRK